MNSSNSLTGIDVKGIVDSLMQDETNKRLKTLNINKTIDDLQIASFSKFRTLLTSFQTSLTNLSSAFNTISYKATSSNTSVLNASVASNTITPGLHTVSVSKLAQAQTSRSNYFGSYDQGLGYSQNLTFTKTGGGSNFSIAVNPGDSLKDVIGKINSNTDNFGVSASALTTTVGGVTQYSLVLSVKDTGAANGFNVTGGSSPFTFTDVFSAQDAEFTIDGVDSTSATNVIGKSDGTGGVLPGLSMTLTGTGTSQINIEKSTADQNTAIKTAMNNMLSAYNDMVTFIDKTQIDRSTNNIAFSFVKNIFQSEVSKKYTGPGDINNLFQLGIKLANSTQEEVTINNPWATNDSDKTYKMMMTLAGKMELNDPASGAPNPYNNPKFSEVLSNNLEDMKNFFTDPTNGFIARVNKAINEKVIATGDKGLISGAESSLQTKLKNVNEQIAKQNEILETVRENLIKQWSNLNVVLKKMESEQGYLTAQFSSLMGSSSSNK